MSWQAAAPYLDRAQRRRLVRALPPLVLPYCRVPVSIKQEVFLRLPVYEAFYGGAAGGGKSIALLAAALQHVDQPGYAALLLRRTFPELNQPGGLLDVARRWLGGTDAKWQASRSTWVFPSGATLTFGHMAKPGDELRYAGSEYQFVGFDELTQFAEWQYRFLFSRLRRRHGVNAPLRMRSASNPGGPGHVWVKRRLVDPRTRVQGTSFVAARLTDNPGIQVAEYLKGMENLPPLLRAQLVAGDWDAVQEGQMFPRADAIIVDRFPYRTVCAVRSWDVARSKPKPGRQDPDYTVGARWDRLANGQACLSSVVRLRGDPKQVREAILGCIRSDGPSVPVWIEMEGGGLAGLALESLQREAQGGASVQWQTVAGADKPERARPMSNAWLNHQVLVRRASWNEDVLDEFEAFPEGAHDDIVDACSLGWSKLPAHHASADSAWLREQLEQQVEQDRQGADPFALPLRAGLSW